MLRCDVHNNILQANVNVVSEWGGGGGHLYGGLSVCLCVCVYDAICFIKEDPCDIILKENIFCKYST